MSDAILIVNDAELTVANDAAILAQSPGYATVHDGQLLLGQNAYAHARLNPTQTHSTFWQELSQDPLPAGSSTVARHADLVFAHLRDLWQSATQEQEIARVALVVAGDVSRAQLGLLLGICRQVGIPVRAMVQDALLAAQSPVDSQMAFLDLHLHRSLITPLEQSSELVVAKAGSDKRLGLTRFKEAFVNAVSDSFIRSTRFDPMHSAGTEQEVYNRLTEFIAPLGSEMSTSFQIEHGETAYATELRRDHLFASAGELYDRLLKQIDAARKPGEPLTVIASQRIAGLPGLGDLIRTLEDVDISEIDPLAMATAAMSLNLMGSSESSLKMITRRRWEATTQEQPSFIPHSSAARPTHLLMDAKALAINSEPLFVGTAADDDQRTLTISNRYPGVSRQHFSLRLIGKQVFIEDLSTYGTYVNGQRIQGRVEVFRGDHIRIGNPGAELTLISVEAT